MPQYQFIHLAFETPRKLNSEANFAKLSHVPPYPNLISESLLISETVTLLRSFGGRASAVSVVDFVMKIRRPDRELAISLAEELISADPRLQLNGEYVELISDGSEERELAETEFVVFDLETTGSKTPPSRITEIGAYKVLGGEVIDKFHTLVNPEMHIPEFITRLTRISDEMVRDAPLFAEVVDDFLQFIGDAVLVAHNSGFDMRFLNYEIGRVFAGHRLRNQCLCTVQLSRRLITDIPNHKLKTVAEYYCLDLVDHHRAAADAYATAHIFIDLVSRLHDQGISNVAAACDYASRKNFYARRPRSNPFE